MIEAPKKPKFYDGFRRLSADFPALDLELNEAGEESTLPPDPDWDAINKLSVHMYETQRGLA